MQYNPEIHHRKSIRLKEFDYSQAGYYFVTICTYQREHLFGEIVDGKIQLNEFVEIVKEELLTSEEIRKEIKIDYYSIMPNHIHAIIIIDKHNNVASGNVGANGRSPLRMQPKSLSSFISGYKSVCTKRINEIRNSPGIPLWQRNYYEHVIRNEKELYEIRNYIEYNPLNWKDDEYNK
ncbi:MAG: transposase [Candidatus Kapabacteria bacterium]|nr:transposase [Candidatus Kapabacteria bacterium]